MPWHHKAEPGREYGPAWRKLRAQILKRDSFLCQCAHCKEEGRTSIATEVDHIISRAKAKGLGWSKEQIEHPSNLQSINAQCHKRKTIEEEGKRYKPPRPIGLDGFPKR